MPLTPLTPAVGKGKAGKAGSWYLDFSGFTVSFQVDSKTSTSKPLFPGVLTGTGRIRYAGFF
jgi:hypothetical protein